MGTWKSWFPSRRQAAWSFRLLNMIGGIVMKWRYALAYAMMITLVMTGCGAAEGTNAASGETVTEETDVEKEESADEKKEDQTEEAADEEEKTDEDSESNGAVDLLADFSEEDQFSKRDLSSEYEESEAETITLSENGAKTSSKTVSVDGGTVTITQEGVYVLTGTLKDGMVIVDADQSAKIQLVLKGVTIHSETSAAIYVKQADKVFLTLEDGTENVLTSGSSYEAIDENNIDAVIFSKEDLTLGGTGSLTIESPAGHGIVSKDDLVVADGTYTITAAKDALSGKDSVRIAGGSFVLDAGDDGVRSGKEDESYIYVQDGTFQVKAVGKGFGAGSLIYIADGKFYIETEDDAFHSDHSIYIKGGAYAVAAGDDGFHANSALYVVDGNITVAKSYEGLEAQVIDIAGGEINITSTDDGINAAGGNDGSASKGGFGKGDMFDSDQNASITISGGAIHISAEGDGVDSNGYITIKGGETYVTGPTSSGNGSLDSGIEAVIEGGIFVAAGASGMAENFSESSTQGCMLVMTNSQDAGSKVQLSDSTGKSLIDWTSDKAYECVLISMPEIEKGQTYTLTAGTFSGEITMDTLVYGSGNGMGAGGRMKGGRPDENQMEGGNGQKGHGRRQWNEEDQPGSGQEQPEAGNQAAPDSLNEVDGNRKTPEL